MLRFLPVFRTKHVCRHGFTKEPGHQRSQNVAGWFARLVGIRRNYAGFVEPFDSW